MTLPASQRDENKAILTEGKTKILEHISTYINDSEIPGGVGTSTSESSIN